MGIKVTPAGVEYIEKQLCAFTTDSEGRTTEYKYLHQQDMIQKLCDILQAELVKEPMTMEQLLFLGLGPVEELKEGRRGKLDDKKFYGRNDDGEYYLEHHAPANRVVKGWHKTLIKKLKKKPNKDEAELLFKVGQVIINGKQDGFRT